MASAESNLLGPGGVQRTQCYTLGWSGMCEEVAGGWWGAICGPNFGAPQGVRWVCEELKEGLNRVEKGSHGVHSHMEEVFHCPYSSSNCLIKASLVPLRRRR